MRPLSLPALALALALAPSLASANGVDSLRLDPVPVDARVDCDRVFFSSSQRLPGTIFVMPRVAIGQAGDSQLFAIEPMRDGTYLLHVGVHFPRDDERIKPRFNRAVIETSRCNFESVSHFLNKKAKEEKSAPISTIARMPLTSIEVEIPGLSQPYRIGRLSDNNAEADILSYFGTAYTAEFRLNEEEKDTVIRRLSHDQGLQFNVLFRFQARRFDGSISAEVNWKSVAKGLEAQANGRVSVTKAELRTMISSATTSTSVKISREEGQSEAFGKVADRIVEMVLANPELEQAAVKEDDKLSPPESGEGKLFNVKAAASYLAKQNNKSLQYEQLGRPETATASSSVNIRTRIVDPWTREVLVVSGEADPTVPDQIKAGDRIRVTPVYWYETTLAFRDKISYLTKAQLSELDLVNKFPDLESGQMDIDNKEVNGRLVARGRWNISGGLGLPVYSGTQYSWKRVEKIPEEIDGKSVRVYEGEVSLDALKDIPVAVTFSDLGRRMYRMADLLKENANWTAEFTDSGAIQLVAKRDLGLMTLRESYKEGVDYQVAPVVIDQVTQISRAHIGGVKESAPVVLQTKHRAKVKTTTMVFYVSREPETPAAQAQGAVNKLLGVFGLGGLGRP